MLMRSITGFRILKRTSKTCTCTCKATWLQVLSLRVYGTGRAQLSYWSADLLYICVLLARKITSLESSSKEFFNLLTKAFKHRLEKMNHEKGKLDLMSGANQQQGEWSQRWSENPD
eukprot:TRINITY_DN3299_c0_g1_i4.p1 TRINITY_DN3299_c0_g1~~TRINITY_DN3299_c0_g1_i4.p1  ORF type:complete len:116 (-),score=12.87 TRINITY_DN3299_c0_g1_i4:441-788(-)